MLERLVSLGDQLPSMAMMDLPVLPSTLGVRQLPLDPELTEILARSGYNRAARLPNLDGSITTGRRVYQRGLSMIVSEMGAKAVTTAVQQPSNAEHINVAQIGPYLLHLGRRVICDLETQYNGNLTRYLANYKTNPNDPQDEPLRGNVLFYPFASTGLNSSMFREHIIATGLALDIHRGRVNGKNIVDLGSGSGLLTALAIVHAPKRATCVDNNPTALGAARKLLEINTRIDTSPKGKYAYFNFFQGPIYQYMRSERARTDDVAIANIGPHGMYGGRDAGGGWGQLLEHICCSKSFDTVFLGGLFEAGPYSIHPDESNRLERAGYSEIDSVMVNYIPSASKVGNTICHVYERR